MTVREKYLSGKHLAIRFMSAEQTGGKSRKNGMVLPKTAAAKYWYRKEPCL
jgi:hypothetical protein